MTGASYDTDVAACRFAPHLAQGGLAPGAARKCHPGQANRPGTGLAPPLLMPEP
jgi:hypothetical protein